jgi:hypothetical protein
MSPNYLSVPRVNRLEYLDALLQNYHDDFLDEAKARQAVQQKIQEFEQIKARALRQHRLRLREGASTYQECVELAQQMGIIDRFKQLKSSGHSMLDPTRRRSFLLERIWQTYPRFSQIVLTARDHGELDVPFHNWDKQRKLGNEYYGLNMDRNSFEILRDFAFQLGLLNWYPTANGRQLVYPIACVVKQSEFFAMIGHRVVQETYAQICKHATALELGILRVEEDTYHVTKNDILLNPEYLILHPDLEIVFVKDHKVPISNFEQAVWTNYLHLADMVPMSPVLYPSLRNLVCGQLRIGDEIFDHLLKILIRQPQRLNIHPSDGTLNYAANLGHISKLLPPQTSEGNFIVYLKIERRNVR